MFDGEEEDRSRKKINNIKIFLFGFLELGKGSETTGADSNRI